MQPDLAFIRSHFPGLAGDWVYMDNAGGSHVLATVADRIRDFLLTTPVQHGASYAPSREASARVAAATAAIAGMINAARPEEVVMGPSTTFLFQQLARGMADSLQPGDEIVVTDVDHESNIGPWRSLERLGVVIREWRVDPRTFELELDALGRLLGPRTRLVCVTHCSNVLGTINPIPAIAERVHAAGAELCVDGVALAPHRRVDVQALGCDWYAYSFYKTYGPHHAVLWGRHERLLELASLNHDFIGKDRVPYKLQPGNVNYELAWGCGAIPDYLAALAAHHGAADAFAVVAAQEEALAARLLDWLGRRNDVRIVGRRSAAAADRVPTVSFTVQGRRSSEIVAAVDRHRVGIRYGDFYARRLIDHLGLQDQDGVVRVSMVHYNTLAEVDRLIAALDETL
ncbi:MAG: cysteine desulfurase-like protein [Geminicoccaceae bacterium]